MTAEKIKKAPLPGLQLVGPTANQNHEQRNQRGGDEQDGGCCEIQIENNRQDHWRDNKQKNKLRCITGTIGIDSLHAFAQ